MLRLTLCFLNSELEAIRTYEDVAARCLAFAGDIHYAMWTDVCAQSSHRLHLVLLASKKATVRIAQLVAGMPEKPLANNYGYLGKFIFCYLCFELSIVAQVESYIVPCCDIRRL